MIAFSPVFSLKTGGEKDGKKKEIS